MARRPAGETCLCYLDAAEVRTPAGSLAGIELLGPDDHRVGHVKGVLINPRSCRLKYLVVDSTDTAGRCCLVSTDALIHLAAEQRTLRAESLPALCS